MMILPLSLYALSVPKMMCCNMLQRVAVCCSRCAFRHADIAPQSVRIEGVRTYVLQRVAVYCSVLQRMCISSC